jgi:hypothetical protein
LDVALFVDGAGVDGNETKELLAAVSDGSLAPDGEADARVGGALGGERESSLRRDCLSLGILFAFVLQKRTRRGLGRRERKSKAGAFSFL